MTTTILYRPVGPAELELIAAAGFRAFPPRLPEQPIFYPVTNEAYAVRMARGAECTELWVPAEELDEFNRHIVGSIEVVAEFR
jgi:hypothetical protein